MGEQASVDTILNFLNRPKCQNMLVCFGRVKKTDKRYYGTYQYSTHSGSKRRGGGFLLWIKYKNVIRDHRNTARAMLNDYQKDYRQVKTKVVNPSLDLLFQVNGSWVKFGDLLPFDVRELRLYRCEIEDWVDKWVTIMYWPDTLQLDDIQNLDEFTRSVFHDQ